jgi:hypothetical protein
MVALSLRTFQENIPTMSLLNSFLKCCSKITMVSEESNYIYHKRKIEYFWLALLPNCVIEPDRIEQG